MRPKTNRRKLWATCYQIAGGLLLSPDQYTPGQRDRLTELLLNTLSEPDRYSANGVETLRRAAVRT